MSYKIAVASSDGKQVDEAFGAVKRFLIYEAEDGTYRELEERIVHGESMDQTKSVLQEGCGSSESCSAGNGCTEGIGNGCGGAGEMLDTVELLSDCRCVVCKKIGFHIQKQLERKAISSFDVCCPVGEALEKIALYFKRMDHHESLRIRK